VARYHFGGQPVNGPSKEHTVQSAVAMLQRNIGWQWELLRIAYPPGMLRELMPLIVIRAFAANRSVLKTAWYSFITTDLPELDTLLVAPKVFGN
jgi:hypothetical protein